MMMSLDVRMFKVLVLADESERRAALSEQEQLPLPLTCLFKPKVLHHINNIYVYVTTHVPGPCLI